MWALVRYACAGAVVEGRGQMEMKMDRRLMMNRHPPWRLGLLLLQRRLRRLVHHGPPVHHDHHAFEEASLLALF